MMTSLLDYDPNVDGIIEHFGVKGMRWGVRRERKRGQRIRKAYTTSDALGRNKEATAAKVAQLKVDKASAMKNYEEHLSEHNAKTNERVSKMKAEKKSLLDSYDEHTDYIAQKAHKEFLKKARGKDEATINKIEKESIAKANKKISEIQAEKKAMGADYDKGISKYKAKRQKQANEIRTEMVEQGKEWDAAVAKVKQQNTGKSIESGKKAVNIYFTGNEDGRITKSTVVGYGLAAAMIGAMAYDMYRG